MYLGYESVEMLGHVIAHGKVHPMQNKVDAISRLKPPTNVTQVKSFLGLIGFYRRFILEFATLSHPLVNLLKGGVQWEWTEVHQ